MKHLGMPLAAGLAWIVALSPACSQDRDAAPAGQARYPLTGLVLEGADASGQVTIAHDAIEGFMPAMAMPLAVGAGEPALGPDDRLTATLVVTGDKSWVEGIRITSKGRGRSDTAVEASTADRLIGRQVPDFGLRDHDSREIRMADFRGEVVFITFIYTRCPLPDFCPRMMSHLNAIKRNLERDANVWSRVRLMAVSIDPNYDTPAVLRSYGERMVNDPGRFERVTLATGEPSMIQALAGFFGVRYREDSGQISHSLSSAVISPDGRVAALFRSNTWSPDDAVAVIRQEATRHAAP